MSAITRNYTIEQGATFTRIWSKKDADDVVIPLDGFGARMQARTSIASVEKVIDLDSATDDELSVNTTTDKVTLSLSAETTAALDKSPLVYDVEIYNLTDPTIVYRWLKGTLTIDKEVTR